MKILALGMSGYLDDKWNQLDMVIVILSVIGIILECLEMWTRQGTVDLFYLLSSKLAPLRRCHDSNQHFHHSRHARPPYCTCPQTAQNGKGRSSTVGDGSARPTPGRQLGSVVFAAFLHLCRAWR